MAITLKDVQELRDRISESRRRLEEQEKALEVLEAMLAETDQKSPAAATVKERPVKPAKPFTDILEEAIKYYADKEFTVAEMHGYLEVQNLLPKGSNPKARIAQTLTYLEKRGVVKRTFRGQGSEPHRFRALYPVDFL